MRGERSRYNIERNKWLKEFMLENPPRFPISARCCQYAKKDLAHDTIKNGGYQLDITGLRRAEGGVRSGRYKSCYNESDTGVDIYMPLWWYTNADKEEYSKHYGIMPSRCYTEYGLKRTGCVGCPFGRDFEDELDVIANHEPKFSKAVNNIFGESYEYTKRYREFAYKQQKQNK